MAKTAELAASAPSKYVPPVERKSGWDDYDLKDFLRTLHQAEKIKANKPLMAALRKEAAAQLKAAQATHAKLQGGSK